MEIKLTNELILYTLKKNLSAIHVSQEREMVEENYPLPLTGLRHFLWAAKLGSFRLAAEKLFVSEAAISQQIRKVESGLGVKLFIRKHQKVSLTPEGRKLLPYVQTAFTSLYQGVNSLAEDPNPNRISISTMPSLATHWLIQRLVLFNQKHPDLSITMDTSVEQQKFDDGNLDLAIRYGQGTYPNLKSIKLMNDPTVLVCSPRLLKGNKITKEDIIKIPMIVGITDGVQTAMQNVLKAFGVKNSELSETLLLKDGSLGAEAARSGQGISLQRISLVAEMIEKGELVYATEFAFHDYSFYAVAPESHFSKPKVVKFMNWLQSEMEKTYLKISPLVESLKKQEA